jgi:hypothetical protein
MKFTDRLSDAFEGDEPDQEQELDAEFPLGDGTAETDALVTCPCCGESVEITLDPGSGDQQEYVEDCEVCCQPWQVSVRYDDEGHADVTVLPLSE